MTNSDLAFSGRYVYQGNYNGYVVWDVSNPAAPTVVSRYLCPASQSDVSVYGNLLFVSAEAPSARTDCGTQGVQDTVSEHRLRGIRVLDVTDVRNPRYLANVQTCRGSHTHTVVSDPRDNQNVYIYVSGSSGVRHPMEMPGCIGGPVDQNPNTAQFRIEVIQVPLSNPAQARLVNSPHILAGLVAPPGNVERDAASGRGGGGGAAAAGRGGGGGAAPSGPRPGPTGCHDITTYPAIGLAGGACSGYGVLLDISDVKNPRRIDAVADSNMAFWHSATFSNDGSKVLFSDEWGGGSAPRCRATDKLEWGANSLFTIENRRMRFHSYYKMPAAQTENENCVAHNGSLIPIPGRDVMVQAFYQGGITIFDWTDVRKPFEIAYYDRGPMDSTRLVSAGSWSAYWFNGYIYSSEIARGLDVYELQPSGYLTQNEIDAAKTVIQREFNPQEQPKLVWPPSFAMARAFLDQLQRNDGFPSARISAVRAELSRAEGLSGAARSSALSALGSQIAGEVRSSRDQAKVRMLADAVRDLANAQR